MLLNDCIKIMGSGMLLLVMLAQPILFSFLRVRQWYQAKYKNDYCRMGILLCNHLLGSYCECLSSTWHVLLGIIKLLSAFYVARLAVKVWGFHYSLDRQKLE